MRLKATSQGYFDTIFLSCLRSKHEPLHDARQAYLRIFVKCCRSRPRCSERHSKQEPPQCNGGSSSIKRENTHIIRVQTNFTLSYPASPGLSVICPFHKNYRDETILRTQKIQLQSIPTFATATRPNNLGLEALKINCCQYHSTRTYGTSPSIAVYLAAL